MNRSSKAGFFGGVIGALLMGLLRATVGRSFSHCWWSEILVFLMFIGMSAFIAYVASK